MEIEVAVAKIEIPFGQVANESACETIARAGGIEDVFEQIARNHEQRVAPEEHGAIFTALDDERIGAEIENFLCGLPQIAFRRKACALRYR